MTTRNHFQRPECDWETWAPSHVAQVFYPCRPAQKRTRLRRVHLPELRNVDREEIRSRLYESLEDALGEKALLPVEEET